MLHNYGWLMVYGNVDHPSVEKRGGDVYIHKDDVALDESLSPGDVVTFYLYADDQGLGAEECRVEQKAASHFNPNAVEFVPSGAKSSLNVCAEEFVMPTIDEVVDINDVADVFSRLSKTFSSMDDYESEDENQDEEVSADLTSGSSCSDVDDMANVFLCLSKAFSSDSEDEDDEDHNVATPCKAKRAPSSAGSTSGGETSDFEEDVSAAESSDSETEAPTEELTELSKRLPLGMALPFQFRPPPGLEFELAF